MSADNTIGGSKQELYELEKPQGQSGSHIVDIERADVTATPSSENLSEKDSKNSDKKKKGGKKNKGTKDEKAEPEPRVSYFQLYRFASAWDWTCVLYVL